MSMLNGEVTGGPLPGGEWLESVTLGPPHQRGALCAVPLFAARQSSSVPLALGQAIAAGTVSVQECPVPSVGHLLLANGGKERVLALGGEILRGGKQDRTINASFILAPGTSETIEVSCVERGRWAREEGFSSAGTSAPASLRAHLHAAATSALSALSGRPSPQVAVWDEIARARRHLGSSSHSDALLGVYAVTTDLCAGGVADVRPAPGQCGVAFFMGNHLVSLDLFGHTENLVHYLPQLSKAALVDNMLARQEIKAATTAAREAVVRTLLGSLSTATWCALPAAKGGSRYHSALFGLAALALLDQGGPVHLQALPSRDLVRLVISPRAAGTALALEIVVDGRPTVVRLRKGSHKFGRSSECAVQIADSSVSRRHGVLIINRHEVSFRDEGSTNGTWLKGEAVTFARLEAGDELVLGKHVRLRIVSFDGKGAPA